MYYNYNVLVRFFDEPLFHQIKFELRSAGVTNPTDGEAWRAIPAASAAQRGQMLCLSRRLHEKKWQTSKKNPSGGQFSKIGNLGCGRLVCHMKGYERTLKAQFVCEVFRATWWFG